MYYEGDYRTAEFHRVTFPLRGRYKMPDLAIGDDTRLEEQFLCSGYCSQRNALAGI